MNALLLALIGSIFLLPNAMAWQESPAGIAVPPTPTSATSGSTSGRGRIDGRPAPRSVSLKQGDRETRRVGSISGRVTGDAGQPLVGAGVFVRRAGPSSGMGRTIGTDEDGRFRAEDLPPGAYTVGASMASYVLASDSAQTRYYRLGDVVTIRMTKGGVITGTVTNSAGEPVVAARVFTMRVRDGNGRALRQQGGPVAWTDDRGIYRIYSLQSGSYLVSVNGGQGYYPGYAYDGDVPVYHPSSTRDTATEVPIQTGQEATGIDIRYRSERGHAISGTIVGFTESSPAASSGVSVSLINPASGSIQSSSFISARENTRAFAIYGVPDGDYQLIAQFTSAGEGAAASAPRRVTVKGSDVTGIELVLAPLGSITGRLTLETIPEAGRKPECKDKERRGSLVEEAMVMVRRDLNADKDRSSETLFSGSDGAPNDKGEFTVYRLVASRYHVQPGLPGEEWFVRAITLPGATPARPPTDVSRDGLGITAGQRITGLTITASEGAAGLRGKVVPATERASLPARLRVHLVPAERESADDALRFFEALVDTDGVFSLSNLAPGRYFALAREVRDDEWMERTVRPAVWDSATRAKLHREAEAAKVVIELQQCQRVADYVLKYSPVSEVKKPRPGK